MIKYHLGMYSLMQRRTETIYVWPQKKLLSETCITIFMCADNSTAVQLFYLTELLYHFFFRGCCWFTSAEDFFPEFIGCFISFDIK